MQPVLLQPCLILRKTSDSVQEIRGINILGNLLQVILKEITLKEACLKLGYVSAEEFDRIVDPYKMTHPFS